MEFLVWTGLLGGGGEPSPRGHEFLKIAPRGAIRRELDIWDQLKRT